MTRRFESPDEVRVMTKGRFEIVHVGGLTIGRATYEPGWKWSEHIGPAVGARRCTVEHVGLVLSGTATAAFEDGTVVELRAGELFYIPRRQAGQLQARRSRSIQSRRGYIGGVGRFAQRRTGHTGRTVR